MAQRTPSPIIIIGSPRSGTSITAKIIQDHFGEFPFKVNRHNEPEELVQMTRDFLKRNDRSFDDRFHFPDLKPDIDLIKGIFDFLYRYKDVECVIKEPIFTAFYAQFPIHRLFRTIYVSRYGNEIGNSLMYHKEMRAIDAFLSVEWFQRCAGLARYDHKIEFSGNQLHYAKELQRVFEEMGLIFRPEILQKHYKQSEIRPYENSNNNR